MSLSDFIATKLGFNKPPAHEPAPATLTAPTYAERTAALQAREREIGEHHDLIIRDLDRQRGEALQARDAAIEEARALVEAQAAKADAEIAEEVNARVYPLVRQLVHGRDAKGKASSPRETATELARVWRELAARVEAEVGGGRGINADHLAFALLECLGGDEAARAASNPRFWDGGEVARGAVHAASRAMLEACAAPVVEDAIRRADVVLSNQVRATCSVGASVDQERVQAHRKHACATRAMLAVQRHDAARQERERQQNIAHSEVVKAWLEHDRDAERAQRFANVAKPKPPRFSRDAASVTDPDVIVNPDMTVPTSVMHGADRDLSGEAIFSPKG